MDLERHILTPQQQQISKDLSHFEETNLFTLDLKISGEVLTMVLTDLQEGVVYGKKYMQNTCEEEIGKGFQDLFDVFMIFLPPEVAKEKLNLNDQGRVRESAKNETNLKQYKYGDVVKNAAASYKVFPGKIEIQCEIERGVNFKKKKVIKGQLKFERIRQMSEKDFYSLKLGALRKQLMLEVGKNNAYIQGQLISKINIMQEKLRNYEFQRILQGCQYRTHYKIQGRVIERIFGNGSWTQLAHPEKFKHGEKRKTRLRIIYTKSRNIMFGVMDQIAVWTTQSPYQGAGAFSYSGVGGQVCNSAGVQKTEGGGFNTGDEVEMEVDLNGGILRWFVNGDLKCTYSNNILKDVNKAFCPYIETYNIGDIIEWLSD